MPNNDTQQIVNKAWSFAHLLRDDGLSYMAYTEQITFLLFLKMAHEQTPAAVGPCSVGTRRTRLAEPAQSRRRGVGNALSTDPDGASQTRRDAGGDLQKGAAGDPESGDTEAFDCQT